MLTMTDTERASYLRSLRGFRDRLVEELELAVLGDESIEFNRIEYMSGLGMKILEYLDKPKVITPHVIRYPESDWAPDEDDKWFFALLETYWVNVESEPEPTTNIFKLMFELTEHELRTTHRSI